MLLVNISSPNKCVSKYEGQIQWPTLTIAVLGPMVAYCDVEANNTETISILGVNTVNSLRQVGPVVSVCKGDNALLKFLLHSLD